MRVIYEQQLKELHNNLILMGAMCEHAISLSVKAFLTCDTEIAQEVIKAEAEIDDKYTAIENQCIKLLLKQTPVATDFRVVSAALKMITDLERIGDQACDIAELVRYKQYSPTSETVKKMALNATKMVTDAIDSFVKRDLAAAGEVIKSDDIVDALFIEARKEIITEIKAATSEEEAESIADALMIIKYMERIGDHATNVAEWVVFSITGEHKDRNTGV